MNFDDPGILCFQHLKGEAKVFGFEVPDVCKFCQANLLTEELHIPPFRVPYPFKNSSKEFNAVVIKPSLGDFLNIYENSSDLHIGVTDSAGFVIEYDINGLQRSKSHNWNQCLPIKILKVLTPALKIYWDKMLYQTARNHCWSSERYDAGTHNCYSFVLSFLRSLQMNELQPYLSDKVTFCKYFVTPQSCIAAKYISLYRQLKQDSSVM